MTFRVETPPHFRAFTQKIKEHAPPFPIAPARPEAEERATARQRVGIISALLDGLDRGLPRAVSRPINALLTDSPADFVRGEVEETVVARLGGAPVAGVYQLMQGAHQELTRVDAMIEYLLGTEGYVSTLARSAVLALSRTGQPRLPQSIVPAGRAALQGHLRGRYRTAYVNGRNRVREVFDILNRYEAEPGEAHPTTRCLIALMDEAGYLRATADLEWRAVRAATDVIEDKILDIDMREKRRQLMVWCREA